jgi:hypothetical protein
MGSLFSRDRRMRATAATRRAAPTMIAKITSIIIGFPFPSFHAPNVNFTLRIRGDAAPEYDSSLV